MLTADYNSGGLTGRSKCDRVRLTEGEVSPLSSKGDINVMPTGMKYQGLRELFLITQWKDDCVYRTRSVGYGYVTLDYKSEDRNLIISSLNTAMSKLLLPSQQMIKVADNAPDIVRVSITITQDGKVKIGE